MVKRLILILALLVLPSMALAEDSSLGPTTGGTGTSDPGTGNILQPAPTSLQGTGSDLQQPLGQSSIQQPATREQVEQYLMGELAGPKGSAPEPEESFSILPVILISAGLFLFGVGVSYMLDHRKKRSKLPNIAPPEMTATVTETKKKAAKKTKHTKKKPSRPRK